MNKLKFLIALGGLVLPLITCAGVAPNTTNSNKASNLIKVSSKQKTEEHYQLLPDENKKYWISSSQYLIYSFSTKPQIGTTILKIEIFSKENKKDTAYEIIANSDMRDMPEAHNSGDQKFQLSNKGTYLLPIGFVMLGDWEIKLKLIQNKQVVFLGLIKVTI